MVMLHSSAVVLLYGSTQKKLIILFLIDHLNEPIQKKPKKLT